MPVRAVSAASAVEESGKDTADIGVGDLRVRVDVAPVRSQVADRLRKAIAKGYFGPGHRLVERELVELTGASRSTVREALRELEAERLLTTVPYRGVVVAVPTLAQAEELYEVREHLDGLVVHRFTLQATSSDVAALANANMAVQGAGSIREMLAAKEQLYDVLQRYSATVNEVLTVINGRIAALRGISLSQPGRLSQSKSELQEITDAVVTGDSLEAVAATRRHVQQARRCALHGMEGSGWGVGDGSQG